MGFFKKSNESDDIVKTYTEPKDTLEEMNEKESTSSINVVYRKKDSIIMDKKITEYVIKNFPDMSKEIKDSLNNLVDTLEKTIDFIEDKSSYLVKHDRNFELSQAHRDTSISIYENVNEIKDYIKWMDDTYNEEKKIEEEEKETEEVKDDNSSEKDEKNKEEDEFGESINIYENFTGKTPKAFKLEDYFVKVSGWEDLTVKVAEVLNKHYKENRDELKVVYQDMKIDDTKSKENELRDSVIDILNEYNIYLDKFKVYV